MLCILYRIHMPRRSATAELPPHLVRITSVYAGRMCSFMKIKLFGWQRPPRARACTLPWPLREQLRNRVRRRGVCNHKDRHILQRYTEGWAGRYRVFDREYSLYIKKINFRIISNSFFLICCVFSIEYTSPHTSSNII